VKRGAAFAALCAYQCAYLLQLPITKHVWLARLWAAKCSTCSKGACIHINRLLCVRDDCIK